MEGIIRQVLEEKGVEVITTSAQTSIYDCAKLMALNKIGSVVIEDSEQIVGLLHERDISRVAVINQYDLMHTPVKKIMKTKFPFVNLNTKITEALSLINHYRVRHLPVINEGHLVGLISIGDLTKWLLDLQQEDISHLLSYIQGNGKLLIKK
jgi:CBS domain-containing protein